MGEANPTNDLTVTLEASFTYNESGDITREAKREARVFKGFFNGTFPIAIKRYPKDNESTKKQVQQDLAVLSSPKNRHPNFIRYFGYTSDNNFSYLLTELCECSVADVIDPKRRVSSQQKLPDFSAIISCLPPKKILRQSAEAVCFLHRPQWNIIHRNLHPDNFLIACVDSRKNYVIKLTDFQLSKDIEKNPENTGTFNKEGWVAPESFDDDAKLDDKVDSFIMGCYCFYVLSGGKHPFGNGVDDQKSGIKNKNYSVYQANWDGGIREWNDSSPNSVEQEERKSALKMIKSLIKFKPEERILVNDVLKSKYFQLDGYEIYDNQSSPIPGLCVILCQQEFHDTELNLGDPTDGIGLDTDRLSSTFKSFGYDILIFRNLTADQIKSHLSAKELKIRTGKSFKNYASLIVCLLGHGDKGVFLGVDAVPVSLNSIQYDAFNDRACRNLKKKPKVFIVLACQGNREQKLIDGNTQQENDGASSLAKVELNNNSGEKEEQMPPVCDFIRLVSSIEEYMSYFNRHRGSTFIQSLCDTLNFEYGKVSNADEERNKRDLNQLFIEFVIPIVGREAIIVDSVVRKQTPELRSSLVKEIRFRGRDKLGIIYPEFDGGKREDSGEPQLHSRQNRVMKSLKNLFPTSLM